MRWQLSLARQFLLLQLGIVLAVVGVVAAVSIAEAQAAFRSDEGANLRSVAESLAVNDTVRDGLRGPIWYDSLAAVAESARSVSDLDTVVLTDKSGIVLTGPDRGAQARLSTQDGLSGRSWLGDVGDSLVAQAPVLHPDSGEILGLVVVEKAYPSWPQMLAKATPDLLTYLLLGSALGVIGSLLLARRVKRQTLGLEPREITGLVEHREAMLHGIKEGLIGLDTQNRVTLANDEALRLLDLPHNPTGMPMRSLNLSDDLTAALLTTGELDPDHVVLHNDRVLVLNRMPVLVRGRNVGSVTTLRDRTELTSLERATDTLRAQAHEFTNRLHTISGLLQLGMYDDAVSFIVQAGRTQQTLTEEVQSRIADPALAALLIAKAAVASEQRVELVIDPDTALERTGDGDLVTIAGNLIDNAIDAVDPGGWVRVLVTQDEVVVSDSGPGVPAELAEQVFQTGFSTKSEDGQRGLGLALIQRICTARGGSVSVSGSTFTVRLPGQGPAGETVRLP